jgi:tetratricopeptide (TPR) repeat protein
MINTLIRGVNRILNFSNPCPNLFFCFNAVARSFIFVAMPLFKTDKGCVTLDSKPFTHRIIFSLAVAALLVPVIFGSYRVFRGDWIVRDRQTADAYSQALEYDPSNPLLWWNRGRTRHYSVGLVDIPGAISDYKTALALNPRLGQAWVDLAGCYERIGNDDAAEAALEKAFETRTYSPLIRWQAGNFFLRRGKRDKMYECFKLASEFDKNKLGIAMEIAWKADPDHREILQKLIPNDIQSNIAYLAFLIGKDELDLAHPVWQRCLQNEIPPGFPFKASIANDYINRLQARNCMAEALQIWGDALAKAGAALSDTRRATESSQSNKFSSQNPGNLVWNGSFESEMIRGGFDWRYPADSSEMQFLVDMDNRVDGLKSLRVKFGGTNLSFSHLSQIVPVFEPGMYVLDYYQRTDGLTTDQTPYLSIRGYPDASCAAARSGNFPSTSAWSQVSVPFSVKEGCKAIELILRRDPSSKFDNKLKGALWLDGVAIYRTRNSTD